VSGTTNSAPRFRKEQGPLAGNDHYLISDGIVGFLALTSIMAGAIGMGNAVVFEEEARDYAWLSVFAAAQGYWVWHKSSSNGVYGVWGW
jgi:hypothetical protein